MLDALLPALACAGKPVGPAAPLWPAMDWGQPLSRVIVLKSGVKLQTLHDAAEAFLRAFGNVNHDRAVEHAITFMMETARTGDGQVALVFRLKALA